MDLLEDLQHLVRQDDLRGAAEAPRRWLAGAHDELGTGTSNAKSSRAAAPRVLFLLFFVGLIG